MAGWHHRCNGHELQEMVKRQGGLACCSPWGHKELNMPGQLNNSNKANIWGFPGGALVKNLPADAGDAGLIPGSRRSLGKGNGNHLLCMENAKWWAIVHGGHRESDLTERTCVHAHVHAHTHTHTPTHIHIQR